MKMFKYFDFIGTELKILINGKPIFKPEIAVFFNNVVNINYLSLLCFWKRHY